MNRNSNDLNKQSISLEQYGILNAKINYNFSVEKLYQICVENKLGVLTNNNVLAINTGKFTGRSPKDRYIVSDDITAEKVWWGEINRPIKPRVFENIWFNRSIYFTPPYFISSNIIQNNISVFW